MAAFTAPLTARGSHNHRRGSRCSQHVLCWVWNTISRHHVLRDVYVLYVASPPTRRIRHTYTYTHVYRHCPYTSVASGDGELSCGRFLQLSIQLSCGRLLQLSIRAYIPHVSEHRWHRYRVERCKKQDSDMRDVQHSILSVFLPLLRQMCRTQNMPKLLDLFHNIFCIIKAINVESEYIHISMS